MKQWNRVLAIILAFTLVCTTFGSDFAAVRSYAVESEQELEELKDQELAPVEWSEMDETSAEGEEETSVEAPAAEAPEGGSSEENVQLAEGAQEVTAAATDESVAPTTYAPATETSVAEGAQADAATTDAATEDATIKGDDSKAADAATTAGSTEQSVDAASLASSEDAASLASSDDDAASKASSDDAAALASSTEKKLVTVTYTATEGGSVSNSEETIDINDEEAKFEGSTAKADEGYKFDGWYKDGEWVSADELLVPENVEEDTVFEATFAVEEEEPSKPQKTFTGSGNGLSVTVEAPEGAFPAGTEMVTQ